MGHIGQGVWDVSQSEEPGGPSSNEVRAWAADIPLKMLPWRARSQCLLLSRVGTVWAAPGGLGKHLWWLSREECPECDGTSRKRSSLSQTFRESAAGALILILESPAGRTFWVSLKTSMTNYVCIHL